MNIFEISIFKFRNNQLERNKIFLSFVNFKQAVTLVLDYSLLLNYRIVRIAKKIGNSTENAKMLCIS